MCLHFGLIFESYKKLILLKKIIIKNQYFLRRKLVNNMNKQFIKDKLANKYMKNIQYY